MALFHTELLVSILSAIIAYKANINSRKANKIAQESMNFQIAPKNINFTKLELDPSKVKVFGGHNVAWSGKDNLSKELYEQIINLAYSNTLTEIDGNEYLFINLCRKDTLQEDIALVLNAFCFEVKYSGEFLINKLSVERVYSLLDSKSPFQPNMKLNVHKNITGTTITVPIAYAYSFTASASLNLPQIAEISNNKENIINLVDRPEEAGKIIGFVETAYLIKCTTNIGKEFFFTLHMERNSNKLEYQIYLGQEQYKQYRNIATKRIKRRIESIANEQKAIYKIRKLLKRN